MDTNPEKASGPTESGTHTEDLAKESQEKTDGGVLEALVKTAQKEGKELTLGQVAELLKLVTTGTFVSVGIALLSLIGLGFSAGTWYEAHYPSTSESPKELKPIVSRQKPQGSIAIKALPYKGAPEWYADHTYWLEQEGDRDKKGEVIAGYAIGEATFTTSNATFPFETLLSVPAGYEVRSRAAYLLSSGSAKPSSLEILPTQPTDDTFRGLKVPVPECNKNDLVLILFRVSSKKRDLPLTVADIVQGTVR